MTYSDPLLSSTDKILEKNIPLKKKKIEENSTIAKEDKKLGKKKNIEPSPSLKNSPSAKKRDKNCSLSNIPKKMKKNSLPSSEDICQDSTSLEKMNKNSPSFIISEEIDEDFLISSKDIFQDLSQDTLLTNTLRQETLWKGKPLILETGELAKEAQGSILVSYGLTRLLCTVCFKSKPEEHKGFVPLSISYQERCYAVGKIPSSFNRREGKISDGEILLGRLLDRTLRPLFPDNFCHDTQVMAILLSDDPKHQGDLPLLCSLGILSALMQSGIELKTLAVTCGFKKDDFLLLLEYYDKNRKNSRKKVQEEWGWTTVNSFPKIPKDPSKIPVDTLILGCHRDGISMLEIQSQECLENDLFTLCAGVFYALQDIFDFIECFGQSLCLFQGQKNTLEYLNQGNNENIDKNFDIPWKEENLSEIKIISEKKQKELIIFLQDVLDPYFQYLCTIGTEKERKVFFDHLCHYAVKKAKTYQKDILDHKKTDPSLSLKNLHLLLTNHPWSKEDIYCAVQNLWKKTIVHFMTKNKKRLDGRLFTDIRPISCSVNVLPQCHGSALFTRGETQSLVTVTLGGKEEGIFPEDIRGSSREPLMFHYNFPPFSVGEVGKINMVSRREIGHGRLALKGISPVVPKDFPFAIRIVSEILGSSGSSSMASVCGATLALYNSGVPLKNPVGGISLGLLRHEKNDILLTDISALEDNIGVMDFKIARSELGITAIQMDSKDHGLSLLQLYSVFFKGKDVVLNIIEKMRHNSILVPLEDLRPYGPIFYQEKISQENIHEINKKDSKALRELFKSCKTKIDVSSSKATVSLLCPNQELLKDAKNVLYSLIDVTSLYEKKDLESPKNQKPKKKKNKEKKESISSNNSLNEFPIGGHIYEGVVTQILEKEAKISFGFPEDGFLPLGEIADYPIENLQTVLEVGDKIRIRFLDHVPQRGYRLSLKQV